MFNIVIQTSSIIVHINVECFFLFIFIVSLDYYINILF